MKGKHTIWLLIVTLGAVLWVPDLLGIGMFMDGVYNALLSQNLYKGISTFWAPQTIYYTEPAYWDNPPLTMGILAKCYSVFGDHYWVERIYSLVCAILQAGLLVWLWRIVFKGNVHLQWLQWLPVTMWIISPLTGWCYSSNLMENTMALFTTAAIMCSVYYALNTKHIVLCAVMVALLLLLAFISKGPVALFPLAMPVLLLYVNEQYNLKRAVLFSALQTSLFVLFAFALFSFQAPQTFLQNYMDVQVKRALTHDMPGVYKPYQIFIELLIIVLPFVILTAIQAIVLRRAWLPKYNNSNLWWRFILLGLCGTIPIALSIKQRKFYLLPALMPLSIGFAMLLVPLVLWLKQFITDKVEKIAGYVLWPICSAAIAICMYMCIDNAGKPVRDVDMLTDLKEVNLLTTEEKVLRADWALGAEWSLRGYMLRLYDKKLAMPNEEASVHFYLTNKQARGEGLTENATQVYNGKTMDLYKL